MYSCAKGRECSGNARTEGLIIVIGIVIVISNGIVAPIASSTSVTATTAASLDATVWRSRSSSSSSSPSAVTRQRGDSLLPVLERNPLVADDGG